MHRCYAVAMVNALSWQRT